MKYIPFDPVRHKGKTLYEIQMREGDEGASERVIVPAEMTFEAAVLVPWYYMVEGEAKSWLGIAQGRVKAALSAQCTDCANFEGPYRAGYHCQAFPGGIPKDILEGRFDHEMPYPGDHGVRFEEEDDD